MQNQAKNLEFYRFFKKRPKYDLILARKTLPQIEKSLKNKVRAMVTQLELFSTLWAPVICTTAHIYACNSKNRADLPGYR